MTISLLALPSKADVWTRIVEKIAKEQNPGTGSKADIATRLVAERNVIQARTWKNINEHNKQLHVLNSRKTRIEKVMEVLNKIKKCIGGGGYHMEWNCYRRWIFSQVFNQGLRAQKG